MQLEELGGNEDLFTGDARVLDTLTDFGFVAVRPGAAAMSAMIPQSTTTHIHEASHELIKRSRGPRDRRNEFRG